MHFILDDDPATLTTASGIRARFPNTSNPGLLDDEALAAGGVRRVQINRAGLAEGEQHAAPVLDDQTDPWTVHFAAEPIPGWEPPRRMLHKYTIRRRLQEYDTANETAFEAAADAMLAQLPAEKQRLWADLSEIYADDPDLIAVLTAIGAPVDEILAP